MDFYQSPWSMLFRKDFLQTSAHTRKTALYIVGSLLGAAYYTYTWHLFKPTPGLFWISVGLTVSTALAFRYVMFEDIRRYWHTGSSSRTIYVSSANSFDRYRGYIEQRLMTLTTHWVKNQVYTLIHPFDSRTTLHISRPSIYHRGNVYLLQFDTEQLHGVQESRNFNAITRRQYRLNAAAGTVVAYELAGFRERGRKPDFETREQITLTGDVMIDVMNEIEAALDGWQPLDPTK